MKKPNIYQMRHHCSHLKKEAVSLACARDAIAELAELGLTATSFSLGLRATITVKEPPYDTALTVPMRFTPVSIGFNGAFHYTTFGAVFGRFAVEWRKRRHVGGIRSIPHYQLRILGGYL